MQPLPLRLLRPQERLRRLSHSIVVRPRASGVLTEPLAMFIDDRSLAVEGADPDLYFRPREEVYISGEALVRHRIPPTQREIVRSGRCVERLQRIAATVSPLLATEVGAQPRYDGAVVPEPRPEAQPEAQPKGA